MKIRIIRVGIGALTEEVLHVSEIKETTEKIILKRFLDDIIIEVKKEDLFYFEINGFLIRKSSVFKDPMIKIKEEERDFEVHCMKCDHKSVISFKVDIVNLNKEKEVFYRTELIHEKECENCGKDYDKNDIIKEKDYKKWIKFLKKDISKGVGIKRKHLFGTKKQIQKGIDKSNEKYEKKRTHRTFEKA